MQKWTTGVRILGSSSQSPVKISNETRISSWNIPQRKMENAVIVNKKDQVILRPLFMNCQFSNEVLGSTFVTPRTSSIWLFTLTFRCFIPSSPSEETWRNGEVSKPWFRTPMSIFSILELITIIVVGLFKKTMTAVNLYWIQWNYTGCADRVRRDAWRTKTSGREVGTVW